MSMRTYTTTAVDCDGCDECYYDAVPVDSSVIERMALRDGWEASDGGHLCPKCVENQRHEGTPAHAKGS